jgi:hypothetical protein
MRDTTHSAIRDIRLKTLKSQLTRFEQPVCKKGKNGAFWILHILRPDSRCPTRYVFPHISKLFVPFPKVGIMPLD